MTRRGDTVECTVAVAIGMGMFYLGGALILASLALPTRWRLVSLVSGAVLLSGGILVALRFR